MLQSDEEGADLRLPGGERRLGGAQEGAELVERAEGGDPRGRLAYAGTAVETGLAAVAGPGIEPRTVRASGRQGSASIGELNPWTGQNEMWSTSLCLAS